MLSKVITKEQKNVEQSYLITSGIVVKPLALGKDHLGRSCPSWHAVYRNGYLPRRGNGQKAYLLLPKTNRRCLIKLMERPEDVKQKIRM